jgi:hypothetical protein
VGGLAQTCPQHPARSLDVLLSLISVTLLTRYFQPGGHAERLKDVNGLPCLPSADRPVAVREPSGVSVGGPLHIGSEGDLLTLDVGHVVWRYVTAEGVDLCLSS